MKAAPHWGGLHLLFRRIDFPLGDLPPPQSGRSTAGRGRLTPRFGRFTYAGLASREKITNFGLDTNCYTI